MGTDFFLQGIDAVARLLLLRGLNLLFQVKPHGQFGVRALNGVNDAKVGARLLRRMVRIAEHAF